MGMWEDDHVIDGHQDTEYFQHHCVLCKDMMKGIRGPSLAKLEEYSLQSAESRQALDKLARAADTLLDSMERMKGRLPQHVRKAGDKLEEIMDEVTNG